MQHELPIAAGAQEHEEVFALLPWHVNGTLAREEQQRVREHVGPCLVCRREIQLLETLATHARSAGQDAECEAALQRLARRIERAPSAPRAMPWMAAAVLALSTSLVVWAGDNAHQSTAWLRNAGYLLPVPEPVSADDPPLGPHVRLIFHDDITERELRAIVLAVGAAVIEGPTPDGRYTLAFARQMSPGELLAALRQLRYSRQVLYAEPVFSTFSTTKVSAGGDW